MPLIEWRNDFSVNIREVDEQHKKLIAMLNELYDAMSAGKGKEVLSRILDGMAEYTVTHFTTEERLMREYNYPGYVKHKREHESFVRRVLEFREKFEKGEITAVEVMRYLSEWLKNHILGSDKKFGPYLNARGVV